MPNLDNIFNKFFPQSQTTKKGIFLLRMAWTIEILVAVIGMLIGLIIIFYKPGEGFSSQTFDMRDVTTGLIFMIVAVVELTKIPLATAVYYSVRTFWRVTFLIALILVNISTFETIVTGFERISRERVRDVQVKIDLYASNVEKISNLNSNSN